MQLAPWSYQVSPTFPKDENISYAIFESGKSYNFGGLKAQTGRVSAGPAWTKFTFATPFDTIPVVFANQLLSASTLATNVRVRNITKIGFEARTMKETANTSVMGTESVSYLAIIPGVGTFNNKKVIVGKTADKIVGSSYFTINFGDSIANPNFISQMQTCNDDSTAALRIVSLSAKYANVTKQREKSTSSVITTNYAEQVGWMVISTTQNDDTAIFNPTKSTISIYPNPVKDVLYIKSDISEQSTVEIFNIYGKLLKQENLINSKINVSDLTPGFYLIRSHGNPPLKFEKQ